MTATQSPSRRTTLRGGDPGAIAAGLGAVLLFISLFLHWYTPGLTAWTVFEVWDLVLAALAVWMLVMAAGRLGVAKRRPDGWLVMASVAAVVIVVAALINHPPAAFGRDPMVGIWLALAASLLMLAGSALSVANITVAVELDNDGLARATRPSGWRARGHAPAEPPPDPPSEPPLDPRSDATEPTRVIASDPDAPPRSAGR